MKTSLIILIFLFLGFNNFAQKAEYTISAGVNYNFFTMSDYKSDYQQTFSSTSGYTSYTTSTYELEIESKGATGFFVDNGFSFPVNKYIAFKTGFGISLNNTDLITKAKSTYSSNTGIVFDTSFVFVTDTSSVLNPYVYNYDYMTGSDYNIFLLNIPIQLQVNLLNEKLQLEGGLSISALMQAKSTFATNTNKYTQIATNNFENIFFNVNFGFAYNIFDNIYAGLKYDYSVTNVFKTDSDFQSSSSFSQNYYKTHLNNMSLYLSYKF